MCCFGVVKAGHYLLGSWSLYVLLWCSQIFVYITSTKLYCLTCRVLRFPLSAGVDTIPEYRYMFGSWIGSWLNRLCYWSMLSVCPIDKHRSTHWWPCFRTQLWLWVRICVLSTTKHSQFIWLETIFEWFLWPLVCSARERKWEPKTPIIHIYILVCHFRPKSTTSLWNKTMATIQMLKFHSRFSAGVMQPTREQWSQSAMQLWS